MLFPRDLYGGGLFGQRIVSLNLHGIPQKLKDLLNPNGPQLRVRESKHKGVWVDGIDTRYITSEQEVSVVPPCRMQP